MAKTGQRFAGEPLCCNGVEVYSVFGTSAHLHTLTLWTSALGTNFAPGALVSLPDEPETSRTWGLEGSQRNGMVYSHWSRARSATH